jgi:tetratricopeptide (TPR) repeat protein
VNAVRRIVIALTTVAFAATSPLHAADSRSRIDQLLAEAERLRSQQVRRADQAIPLFRQAITLAERDDDRPRAVSGWIGLGNALWSTHQVDDARAAAERARLLAGEQGDDAAESQAVRLLGNLLVDAGDLVGAESQFRSALEFASRAGDTNAVIASLNALSVVARKSGDLGQAALYAQQALAVVDARLARREAVDPRSLFSVPFNVGKSLADAGDYASAIVYFDRAFDAATETGAIGGQWHALHDSAEWYMSQGDLVRAGRYFERSLTQSHLAEARDMKALSLRGLGTVAEARGELDAAIANYSAALDTFRRIGLRAEALTTLISLSRVRFVRGETDAAAALLREATQDAEALHHRIGLTRAQLELGRQQRVGGRIAKAERSYRQALDAARDSGLRPLVPAALSGLAEVAVARGDTRGAIALFRESADAIERLRGRIVANDQRAAFAEAAHTT